MLAPPATAPTLPASAILCLALALSIGAAVSLGISRFAYGLLLLPMRADLGRSYALAGTMNTSNASGYPLGAFTIVFAAGQIIGPTVVGWMADGARGLARGFVASALALWLGAGLALRQRALGGAA